MVGFSSWAELLQTFGGIGVVLVAAAALNRDAKASEESNLLALATEHRELWQASQKPELERVFKEDADLSAKPLTTAETEFLNVKIRHYLTGWRLARRGGLTTRPELRLDMRGFFSRPLPRAVWEKTKEFRNQDFVRFVEQAIKNEI